ncbi:MAG: hypothetical protein ACE5IR_24920 [bacterium]
MKRHLIHLVFLTLSFVFLTHNFAISQGVKKVTKDKVSFSFGVYSSEKLSYINENEKYEELIASKLKGKGFAGKLASKFFPKGKTAVITNLNENKIYKLNLKKKKCEVSPLINVGDSLQSAMGSFKEAMKGWKQENEQNRQQEKSAFEMKESVFRVIDTGDSEVLNKKNCKIFEIVAFTKMEHVETHETRVDSFWARLWCIEKTEALKKAQEIDLKFHQNLMQAMGIEVEGLKQDWTKWIEKLQEVNSTDSDFNFANASKELEKLGSYLTLKTKGKFYTLSSGTKKGDIAKTASDDAEEPTDIKKEAKKKFGGFAKSIFGKKKKKKESNEKKAILSFETYQEYELEEIDPDKFVSPWSCKEK